MKSSIHGMIHAKGGVTLRRGWKANEKPVRLGDGQGVVIGSNPDPRDAPAIAGVNEWGQMKVPSDETVSATHLAVWALGGKVYSRLLRARGGAWLEVPRGDEACEVGGGMTGDQKITLQIGADGRTLEDEPAPVSVNNLAQLPAKVVHAVSLWLESRVPEATVKESSGKGHAASSTRTLFGEVKIPIVRKGDASVEHDVVLEVELPDEKLGYDETERIVRTLYRYVESMRARTIRARASRSYVSPVYASARMNRVLQEVQAAAEAGRNLMLLGSTGVGKTLLARYFSHLLSLRRGEEEMPFIELNCAALTETLIEHELFGCVRGAFSGAERDRKGLMRAAHSGVLFLDEIGDMSMAMQTKILKALEDKRVRPVGSDESFPADFTLVSATHRDLRERVQREQFRADLYYRLSGARVTVPGLAERGEDVEAMVKAHPARPAQAGVCAALPGGEEVFAALEPDAKSWLTGGLASGGFSWPGNVRTLKDWTEHATYFLARRPQGRITLKDAVGFAEHVVGEAHAGLTASAICDEHFAIALEVWRARPTTFENLGSMQALSDFHENVLKPIVAASHVARGMYKQKPLRAALRELVMVGSTELNARTGRPEFVSPSQALQHMNGYGAQDSDTRKAILAKFVALKDWVPGERETT